MATTTMTTTPTPTAPFGGRRCSLCLNQLSITTPTEQAYLLPTFLRQLVALVGFDVGLPLCDGCYGDVISVIDILRQLEKLQKALRRSVEGIRDKKKVATEVVAPILTTMEEDSVAMATTSFSPQPKIEQVDTESIEPTPHVEVPPPQTVEVAASSPAVLTLSTGDYYLGSVPFSLNPPQQENNYHEQNVQNCDQRNDENGDQDHDPEYFPDNSPQDDYDDGDDGESSHDENHGSHSLSMQNQQSNPHTSSLPPPPSSTAPNQRALQKTRKTPGPWNPEKKATILAKRKAAKVEILGLIETAPDGRLYFEGVEIIKRGNSYSCSACDWSDAKMSTIQPEKCPNWAKVRAVKLHVLGIHLRAYRCDKCDKHFTCPKSLRSHLASKLHAENVPTNCPICAMTVPKLKLNLHLWSHKTPAEQEAELASAAAAKPGKVGEVFYPCGKCGAQFTQKHNLKTHQISSCKMRGDEPPPPNDGPKPNERVRIRNPKIGDTTSTPRPPQNRIGIKRSRPFVRHPKVPCEICGRPCSAVYMPNHVWSHKSEAEKETARKFGLAPKIITRPKQPVPLPKVECPVCSKFVWRFYLDRHLLTHQNPEERPTVTCTWPGCGKKFKHRSFMRSHVKFVHRRKRSTTTCALLPAARNASLAREHSANMSPRGTIEP